MFIWLVDRASGGYRDLIRTLWLHAAAFAAMTVVIGVAAWLLPRVAPLLYALLVAAFVITVLGIKQAVDESWILYVSDQRGRLFAIQVMSRKARRSLSGGRGRLQTASDVAGGHEQAARQVALEAVISKMLADPRARGVRCVQIDEVISMRRHKNGIDVCAEVRPVRRLRGQEGPAANVPPSKLSKSGVIEAVGRPDPDCLDRIPLEEARIQVRRMYFDQQRLERTLEVMKDDHSL